MDSLHMFKGWMCTTPYCPVLEVKKLNKHFLLLHMKDPWSEYTTCVMGKIMVHLVVPRLLSEATAHCINRCSKGEKAETQDRQTTSTCLSSFVSSSCYASDNLCTMVLAPSPTLPHLPTLLSLPSLHHKCHFPVFSLPSAFAPAKLICWELNLLCWCES